MNTRIGKRKYIRQRARQAKQAIDPRYYASCYNKTRLTKKKAKEVADKLDIQSYRCSYCPHYHVGRRGI